MAEVEELVVKFLRENPESTPREIADALGLSYSLVRAALYRLRDRGLVARGSRGYVAVSAVRTRGYRALRVEEGQVGPPSVESLIEAERLSSRIKGLESKVEEIYKRLAELEGRVEGIERSVNRIRSLVEGLRLEISSLVKSGAGVSMSARGGRRREDRLLSELESKGIINLIDARRIAERSIDEYVREGKVIVVSSYVVSKEFFERFKGKLPISVDKVNSLTPQEKILLDALVEEGLAYLHCGKEYRLIT